MPMIRLINVAKTYSIGDTQVAALDHINLDIEAGEMASIMGPSGSGKSTLMNLIGCLDRPTSGTYELDGIDVSSMNDDQLAKVRNKKIGFVFQSYNLLPRINALMNAELPLIYNATKNRRERAMQAMHAVGIDQRAHHRPSEMSGGEQQRVAIARALVNDPPLILADEPTGNLDTRTSHGIMEFLQELNKKGITIVIVTHEEDIAGYTRRTVYLRDGKIIKEIARVNVLQHFLSAWQALVSNKLRSFLTILGIVIGVGAVVFLVSFGRGQQSAMTAIFENMGANAIYVSGSSRQMMGGVRPTGSLTQEDAEALANPNKAPAVVAVAPMYNQMLKAVYGNQVRTVNVMGTTPDIQEILNYKVAKGSFFNGEDVRRDTSVCILGDQAAKDLFGIVNPIGETLRVGGRKFDVIGVFEQRGGFMGGNADNFIMIPLPTMQSRFGIDTLPQGHPVQTIVVQAASTSVINAAKDQITQILLQRHHIREGEENDFNVIDMQEILKRMQQSMAVFQVFLASVASISLIVGGIGIMNIMLVSVTERTREIGVRKAIGAKRRDILIQFLVESATLSLTGGVIGLGLAGLGSLAIRGQTMNNMPVSAPISMDIIVIALLVAIFTGIISGTYPAFRAARLDPIESLRHE